MECVGVDGDCGNFGHCGFRDLNVYGFPNGRKCVY